MRLVELTRHECELRDLTVQERHIELLIDI